MQATVTNKELVDLKQYKFHFILLECGTTKGYSTFDTYTNPEG